MDNLLPINKIKFIDQLSIIFSFGFVNQQISLLLSRLNIPIQQNLISLISKIKFKNFKLLIKLSIKYLIVIYYLFQFIMIVTSTFIYLRCLYFQIQLFLDIYSKMWTLAQFKKLQNVDPTYSKCLKKITGFEYTLAREIVIQEQLYEQQQKSYQQLSKKFVLLLFTFQIYNCIDSEIEICVNNQYYNLQKFQTVFILIFFVLQT
ncbi:transmembrane protein, putative (macronuclear) [Tetrahymena thermophila SB210]|uniref:Transmembrane protein, putative n=1 Tax=Tetrahymena thermophila (strain SB210) TaxID=312017 RepID=W7XAE6_TETTS|nr:transmembrane protein, putative [Tetrahymena thermophila SB210]EWS73363.1 transmembrane protein, putative [Tetrahymena thermophila SB210]|eukprot:XP_012654096.1 transmembrane protein, putative [Tetrahymena thermophila SB210]